MNIAQMIVDGPGPGRVGKRLLYVLLGLLSFALFEEQPSQRVQERAVGRGDVYSAADQFLSLLQPFVTFCKIVPEVI